MVTKIWCVEKCTTFWAILYFISRPRPTFPLPPPTLCLRLNNGSQPAADGKNCKMSTLSPTKHYTQTNVKTSKSYNYVQKLEGQPLLISDPNYHQGTPNQERNHVYRVGSPLSWSGVLLPFSRKIFLERYTQFGAVRYPHQTPTKRLCKKLGVRPNSGGSVPPDPPVVASMLPVAGD